jgi:hypothetical protein
MCAVIFKLNNSTLPLNILFYKSLPQNTATVQFLGCFFVERILIKNFNIKL